MSQGYEIPVNQIPPRLRKDNSVVVQFETGELSPNEQMLILENNNQLGRVMFIPENQEALPPKIDKEIETKSLSERLRNVMFVYWSQQGEPEGNFNVWRAKTMEAIIQKYKDLLHD